MKHLIVGDAHVDYSTEKWYLSQLYENFLQLIDVAKEHDITSIIFPGDFFDNRTGVNSKSLKYVKEVLLPLLKDFKLTFLVGNHDIYHKNTLTPNSLYLHLNERGYTIIDKVMTIDGITYVPWICEENQGEIFSYIEQDTAKVCIGHFEFTGFPMKKNGVDHEHGISPTIFNRYQQVISGHFHTYSQRGNVLYTGSLNQMTKADLSDRKALFILDDTTLEIQKIGLSAEYFLGYTLSPNNDLKLPDNLEHKTVYLTVEKGVTSETLNLVKKDINSLSPRKLIIQDLNIIDIDVEEVKNDVEVPKSLKEIIDEVVDNLNGEELNIDKDYLRSKINGFLS